MKTVILRVKFFSYIFGEVDLYRAFFDNICFYLEDGKWGSKFPVIMRGLYNGEVSYENLKKFEKEIIVVREEFSKIEVEKLIWDIDNLKIKCPYFGNMAEDIKKLSDFWRSSFDSENIFDIILRAIGDAQNKQTVITVEFGDL